MFKYLNIAIILIFFAIYTSKAYAATEFLTSWKANTFVDSAYAGKIFPVKGSKVNLAFELLDNNKIVDISKNEVAWFREGSKFESGLGKRIASLVLPTLSNKERVDVKIIVRQYKGADIEKFITIPIASPEIVIDSPYPLNVIPAGLNVFKPLFYFWNTSSVNKLLVSWVSGSEEAQELKGNNILQLSVPDGATNTSLNLAVTAKNPEREFENASAVINLRIK
jgi:hypothetical protein